MISANPVLAGQVEVIENMIRETALPLTMGGSCGGFSGSSVPNPFFGYGRIDARAAVEAALAYHAIPSRETINQNHEELIHHAWCLDARESDQLIMVSVPGSSNTLLLTAYATDGTIIGHGGFSIKAVETLSLTALLQRIGYAGDGDRLALRISASLPIEVIQIKRGEGTLDALKSTYQLEQAAYIPHIAANEQWDTQLAFFQYGTSQQSVFETQFGDVPLKAFAAPDASESIDVKSQFAEQAALVKNGVVKSAEHQLAGSFQFGLTPSFGSSASATSQSVIPAQSYWIGHVTPKESLQWFTGIAISNFNDQAVQVHFEPWDEVSLPSFTWDLEPHGHRAQSTRDMALTGDPTRFRITADGPIAVTHLFGTLDWQELCALPAVPDPGWTSDAGYDLIHAFPLAPELELAGQYMAYFVTNPSELVVEYEVEAFAGNGKIEYLTGSLQPYERRIGTEWLPGNRLSTGEPVVVYYLHSENPLLAAVLMGSHELGLLGGCEAPEIGEVRALQVSIDNQQVNLSGIFEHRLVSVELFATQWRELELETGNTIHQSWTLAEEEIGMPLQLRLTDELGQQRVLTLR